MIQNNPIFKAYQRGMLDFKSKIDHNPFAYADQNALSTAWRQGWDYASKIQEVYKLEAKFELGGAL